MRFLSFFVLKETKIGKSIKILSWDFHRFSPSHLLNCYHYFWDESQTRPKSSTRLSWAQTTHMAKEILFDKSHKDVNGLDNWIVLQKIHGTRTIWRSVETRNYFLTKIYSLWVSVTFRKFLKSSTLISEYHSNKFKTF